MKLSVVATLYESSSFVGEFVRRVCAEAGKITDDYEIILVDDGSPDDALAAALETQKTHPRVTVIELSRNFGHHKAMMTGLERAAGDRVFLIDVDLEEPPELLGRFFSQMDQTGSDVVYGIQRVRRGGWVKRVGGDLAWTAIKALLPIAISKNQSTVRLMKKAYVRQLVRHKEHMTAIGGLWVITGFRQTACLFDRVGRGGTSYSLIKRVRALIDSITSFSERPLYGVFFLGCGMFLASLVVAGYLIFKKLTGAVLSGWISVMVSVWGLGGIVLLCMGIVGIYISRIFIETKNRPFVIIRNEYPGTAFLQEPAP